MSHRSSQISSEIHHALSEILRDELPMEIFGLVTITDVLVTDKLEFARVYISALKNQTSTVETLNRHAKKFGKMLERKIIMRKIPELKFIEDLSSEQFEKIDSMMS